MRNAYRALFGALSPWGKFWMVVGLASLGAAATMSFEFGSGVSRAHAVFLACLSFVTAFAPEAAYSQYEAGRKGVACVLAMLCVPLFGIEFFSHAGYTAGLRGSNIETTMVQNTKWDGAQETAKEDKAALKMWQERLAKLETEKGWVATVTADGLRAQIDSADEAIRQEERRGGCGPKCLKLKEAKGELGNKIAAAEERASILSQIEATKRKLDGARVAAANTEHKSSSVEHQQRFLSKAVALFGSGSLKPTEYQTEGAEQGVNLAMALAGTGLPALALFIMGLYRREGHEAVNVPAPERPQPSRNLTPAKPTVINNTRFLLASARDLAEAKMQGAGSPA